MKKRMRDYGGAGIATELIVEQMRRTRFWFWAFVVAVIAFIISCIRAMMQK